MEWKFISYDVTDSTNVRVRHFATEGEKEGLVVTAGQQTAGRGRRGRSWESPQGDNLYFSVLLRPELEPEKAPMLTLVMAYSVVRVLREQTALPVMIKWPNDLVVNGKKLCGILTEMCLKENLVDYIVIGTGVNVNEKTFPEGLGDKATSIYLESETETELQGLLGKILKEFEKSYACFLQSGDLGFMQEAYNALLINMDRKVRVLDPGNEYDAHALGITRTGELLVRKEDGKVETVFAGEVSVRGIYGYV